MPLDLEQTQKSDDIPPRRLRFWDPQTTVKERPHAVALGTAIGVFIGITPTMPIQSFIAVLLAWMLKANRVSALAGVWINNPFTIIPIYSGSYAVGCVLLNQPFVDLSFDFLTDSTGSWMAQAQYLWGVLADITWPLLVGSTLIGTILALFTYFIVLGTIIFWRRGKSRAP